MLVKGKFKTFGYWVSLVSVIGGLAIFIYGFTDGLADTPLAGQIFLYGGISLMVISYGKFLYDANLITISPETETITFRNIFTRVSSSYSFDDFDGRIVSYQMQGGWKKNLFLIKDKRAIRKISGFMYSNQKEIEQTLVKIKDLGSFDHSFLKSWKILFGLPILD